MKRQPYLLGASILLLALTACATAPPPPAKGQAQVWGELGARPREGLRLGGGGAADPEDYANPDKLPAGTRLVDYQEIGPVVVEARGGAPVPAGRAEIALQGARFEPAVTAVGAGGEVVIVNRGSRTRTVYALREDQLVFEVAVPAGATSAPQPVGRTPGPLQLLVHEEDQAVGHLVVAGGPFHVAPGGISYVLTDLPPGRYEIRAWHPRFPPLQRTVDLAKDRQTRLDLWFTVGELPKVAR